VGDYDKTATTIFSVTAYGQNTSFTTTQHTFRMSRKRRPAWAESIQLQRAWVDYDKDGNLDHVVGNYVIVDSGTDLYCTLDGKSNRNCTPESYKGTFRPPLAQSRQTANL